MLRQGIEDPEQRARFGAVYTLLGGLSIPLTLVSIRLFRTIHPVVVGNGGSGKMGMTDTMSYVMFYAIIAFSIVFVDLYWHRVRLGQFAEAIEQKKLEINE